VAVVGHGEATGPFVELDGLRIERDDRFPVRVTVQFYQATSSATLSADDVARMSAQLDAVYAKADYVGSLVVPAPADRKRPTRWRGASAAPATITPADLPGLARWFQRFGWG
jgi:hypothetical protein